VSEVALSFEGLRSLCQRHGLVFKLNHDTEQIAVLHRVLDEDAPLYLVPDPGRSMAAFVLPLPFRVPADRRVAVGEAVTRLNRAAAIGAWVLDLESGELGFRVTLPVFGAAYDDDGVLFVTRAMASAVDAAAGDLRQIALAGKTSFELWPRAALVPGG
jgi:hypothetical protein